MVSKRATSSRPEHSLLARQTTSPKGPILPIKPPHWLRRQRRYVAKRLAAKAAKRAAFVKACRARRHAEGLALRAAKPPLDPSRPRLPNRFRPASAYPSTTESTTP